MRRRHLSSFQYIIIDSMTASPHDSKMMSLFLSSMTALLLIVTAICHPFLAVSGMSAQKRTYLVSFI